MDDALEARGAACTQPTRRSQTQHGCSEVLPTQGFSRLAGELTRPVCVSRRDGGDHDWLGKCWVYNQRYLAAVVSSLRCCLLSSYVGR
eukprot:2773787-Pleurochrysis_carterae.AAC.5